MKDRLQLAADLLISVGAAILTMRGHDPAEVARRAESVSSGIRAGLQRLEGFGEQHARKVVGCRMPERCDCIICEAQRGVRPS